MPDVVGNNQGNTPDSAQRRWAAGIASVALLLTFIPYLIGLSFAGDRKFLWLGYNLDDSCVYLSWMRQAAAGSAHALNMFTVDAQHGMSMNPLFFVMGGLSGLLHVPLPIAYHIFRILFGALLLFCVWRLIELSTENSRSRKLAFLFVCFSAGFGWIPGLWPAPIDAWQPEAITYLSLYLSPLFAFSLAMQALSVVLLLRSVAAGGKQGIYFAIQSGFCVFALGLTHTYDVVTMYAVFGAIAVTMSFRGAALLKRAWGYAVLAGAVGLPSVLYIYHQLQIEKIFHARMEVKTASGPIINLVLGLGLPLLFAIVSTAAALRMYRKEAALSTVGVRVALGAWILANIAVSYLPVEAFPFQRKMLQGVHIPVAILGGIGAAGILQRWLTNSPRRLYLAAAGSLVALTSVTNVRFMLRDMESFEIDQIQTTHMHRPYINPGEVDALAWLEKNTSESDAIQPIPWVAASGSQFGPIDMTLACILPGAIHRKVYCGHWGETPAYQEKLSSLVRIGLPPERMPEAAREALVRSMNVKYLVFSQKPADASAGSGDDAAQKLMPIFTGQLPLPSWLSRVYTNKTVDIYKVELP